MIEKSRSGRAKCRACKTAILKDAWRYGEEEMSFDFDGTYVRWFHLECAVDRRPTGVSRDLATMHGSELDHVEWGRLVCQVAINRCGRKREATVSRPLWVGLAEDGWAHVVCELDSGRHAVVTEQAGKWQVLFEGSLDDALALLPEQLFQQAADGLFQQTREQTLGSE